MKFVLSLLLLITASACSGEVEGESVNQVAQVAAPDSIVVAKQTVPVIREIAATVRSLDHIKVSAESTGRILRIHAEVGDRVEAGQLLAELDDSTLQVAREASAAALELATAEAQRVKRLFDNKVVPEREWDRAQTSLRQAEAQLHMREIALAKTKVHASSAGVLEARLVGAGDLAVIGTPLFQLYDPARICLEAQLPVSDSAHAEIGTNLEWSLSISNGRGAVSEVSPSSNASSRTVRIRVALIETPLVGDRAPAPGTFGTLRYQVGEREQLSIPNDSIFRIGQVDMVSVREERGWVRRAVVLGLKRGEQTEIMSGLRGGEEVAISK